MNTFFCLDYRNPHCKEMSKTFYLQYQWMPFLVASLALMQYFPYFVFRIVNTDMISLRQTLKGDLNVDSIVRNYFNYKVQQGCCYYCQISSIKVAGKEMKRNTIVGLPR